MEAKQNPFSVYDFLGYLIPGAFFLYGSFIFFKILSSGRIDPSILSSLIFEKNEYYVPFVLFAYMLGHCLSFISSITIEKYSVWRYGYPSAYLFNVHPKPYFEVDKHRGIRTSYRSSVAIFILPVTLLDYVLGHCMSMHELYARSLDKDLVDLLEKNSLGLLQLTMGNTPVWATQIGLGLHIITSWKTRKDTGQNYKITSLFMVS